MDSGAVAGLVTAYSAAGAVEDATRVAEEVRPFPDCNLLSTLLLCTLCTVVVWEKKDVGRRSYSCALPCSALFRNDVKTLPIDTVYARSKITLIFS
jgi:hypothetical protein